MTFELLNGRPPFTPDTNVFYYLFFNQILITVNKVFFVNYLFQKYQIIYNYIKFLNLNCKGRKWKISSINFTAEYFECGQWLYDSKRCEWISQGLYFKIIAQRHEVEIDDRANQETSFYDRCHIYIFVFIFQKFQ